MTHVCNLSQGFTGHPIQDSAAGTAESHYQEIMCRVVEDITVNLSFRATWTRVCIHTYVRMHGTKQTRHVFYIKKLM